MAITQSVVTVTTSATLLHTASGKTNVSVTRRNGEDLYVGGASVTTGNGFPLSGGVFSFELSDGDSLYGINSTDTSAISVLATN